MNTFNTALVIDDDIDLCMLIKTMLSVDIKNIHCAHTIESAKEILAEVHPEVIFMDNNLPDGQGLQFIPYFKSVSPDSNIILISAFDNLTSEAIEAGADGFMEKPLSNSKITAILSRLG